MKNISEKQKILIAVGAALDLQVLVPFTLELDSGKSIVAEALIRDLMYPNGTLFFTTGTSAATLVWEYRQDILAAGYGFTLYGAEPDGASSCFELTDYIEMFSEWGWGSLNKPKPNWMTEWERMQVHNTNPDAEREV